MEDGVFPKARSLCETALLWIALRASSLAGTAWLALRNRFAFHRGFVGDVHSGRVVFMEERRGDLHVVGDIHGCV